MLSHFPEADELGERIAFRLSFGDWCCVVGDCNQTVSAEVFDDDYKATIQAMGFRCPQKRPNRQYGHPRIFAYATHMADEAVNAALSEPRWQTLLMAV